MIKEASDQQYEKKVAKKYDKNPQKATFYAKSMFKFGLEHLQISIDSIEKLKKHMVKHIKQINEKQKELLEKTQKYEFEFKKYITKPKKQRVQ